MAKRNDDGPLEGDVLESDSFERMPMDMALMRMENEQIFSIAKARLRDYEKIKTDLAVQLKAFPEAAADAIYAKPVGFQKDKCSRCGAELNRPRRDIVPESCPGAKCKGAKIIVGGQKYARNLSIRAAETLASSFGFNRTSTQVTDFGGERVKITASFTDYTNGRVHIADSICSPYYTKRGGGREKMPEERFLELKVKAESSKAMREAVLRCIPHPLRIWYMTECEAVQSRILTKEKVAEIVAAFAKLDVSEVDLGLLLGKPIKMGIANDDFKTVSGLYVQARDNPADFFVELDLLRAEILTVQEDGSEVIAGPPGTKEVAAARGVVTGADLMKPKGKKDPKPEKESESSPTVTEEKPSGEVVPEKAAQEKPADPKKEPAKAPAAPPAAAEKPPAPSTAPAAPTPPKGPQSLQGIVNFIIQSGYEAEDFNAPKIFETLQGVQAWVKVLEAILTGRHPQHADYRANPMEPPEAATEGPQDDQDGGEGPPDDQPEQATILPKEDAWDAAERKYKEFMDKIAGYKQTARIQTALEWVFAEKLLSDAQKKAIADAAKARCREIEDAK